MKIISKKLLTALVLLAIAASPLHAQTNEPAESEATNNAEVVTNVPAVTKAKPIEKKSDSAPVRIDHTGIHVGGPNPVDINFPGIPDVTKAEPIEKKSDSTPVRIDHTGIHVGGMDPVDRITANRKDILVTLIPIVAIVMVFGMPIAIVGMFFYFRHRKSRMLHETLRAMVEKGVPIPPELLTKPTPDRGSDFPSPPVADGEKREDLRNGLLLIGAGAGVTAFFGKVGLIILFIGVAMVVVGLIEKKDKTKPPIDK